MVKKQKEKKKGSTSTNDGGVDTAPSNSVGPLRVKNVPRSSVLNEEQKTALKKHFKIDLLPEISADDWEKKTGKEKTALRKSRAIPRWAVQAVVQNPKNLKKVLKGELTKENFQRELVVPKTRSRSKEKDKGAKSPSPKRGGKPRPRDRSRGPGDRAPTRGHSIVSELFDLLYRYNRSAPNGRDRR